MRAFTPKHLFILTLSLLFSGLFSDAYSQTVVNGSFTGVTGNSMTPPGWTNVNGYNPGTSIGVFPSVDVLDINFTAYFNNAAVAVSPSPDGGTWTGLSSIPPDFENEAIEQVVTGFTIGQTYELSFYAANFGGTPFIDPGVVTAYVNGTAVAASPTLNLVANVWTTVTGTFVATATSMTVQIDVIHNTGSSGAGGYYSVDGLTIVPLSNPCDAGTDPPVLDQTSACIDQAATFDLTAITANNTPSGTTLTWHSADPADNGNTLANPSSVSTGTYYAAFYDAVNDCYSPVQPVIISPNPVADFNASLACSGNPVNFTDQSTVASGTITGWDWDFGNGNFSAVQNPSETYATAGNYIATLIVTTAAGCTDDYDQQIPVGATPQASFTVQSACTSDPVIFTDNSDPVNGSITDWSWDFGDGGTSSVQHPTYQFTTAGTHSVTLTVTNDAGCSHSVTNQLSTTSPAAAFNFANGCTDVPVAFTDASTIAAGSITDWSWDFGDGGTSAAQNPVHPYAQAGTYTVTLTVTSDQGCIDAITQQVTTYPIPTAAFSAVVTCPGRPVQFTDQSNISSGSITGRNWNFGDGTTATITNPSHTYSNVGAYTVTLTVVSNQGCSATATQLLPAPPDPQAAFTYTPTDIDILNTLVHFQNGSTGATNYNWLFDEYGGSTAQNPNFFFPEQAGNYVVRLIAYNGICSDTTFAIVYIKDVLLYYVPNTFTPDGDEFNQTFQPVFTNGFDPYDFNMTIFNRWGETVFESNDAEVGWDGTYNGQLVPDGMYTWRIEFKTMATDERKIVVGHVNKLH